MSTDTPSTPSDNPAVRLLAGRPGIHQEPRRIDEIQRGIAQREERAREQDRIRRVAGVFGVDANQPAIAEAYRTFRLLTRRGFSRTQAAQLAGTPGITTDTRHVEDATDWFNHHQLGEQMMSLGPGGAKDFWDSLSEYQRTRLRQLGYDPSLVQPKELGLVGGLVDTVSDVTRKVPGLNETFGWAGEQLVSNVAGTLELADNLAEQTIQRGWRAADLAVREHGWNDAVNPALWTQAWLNVGDGDNTFRPGTHDQLVEIGGSDAAVEIAKLFAKGEGVSDILERWGITVDDPNYDQQWRTLLELQDDPRIRQMVSVANRNKLSPGRTTAEIVANDNPIVSGVVDGVWRMVADPFLVLGKVRHTISAGRALPAAQGEFWRVLQARLGEDFVDDVPRLYKARATFSTVLDDGTEVALVNLEDYGAYQRSLRDLIRQGEISEESAAMIELLDHVFAHDGAYVWRYIRDRPNMEPLVNKVLQLRTDPTDPIASYKQAASAIYDYLLGESIAEGIGYTRRSSGLLMPRLTYSAQAKALGSPTWNRVVDWSLRGRTQRLVEPGSLGADDYESAEIFLTEAVRMLRGDDVKPSLLDDYRTMAKVLEDRGYSNDAIAHALESRITLDANVAVASGETTVDALARVALTQGRQHPAIDDAIRESLRVISDRQVSGDDLVDAFDAALDRYSELHAANLGRWDDVSGFLMDGRFNDDVNELRAVLKGRYQEYTLRNTTISADDARRLDAIDSNWRTRIENPDLIEDQGLLERMLRGRKDPTRNVTGFDQVIEDIVAPLRDEGIDSLEALIIRRKDELIAKYDKQFLDDLLDDLGSFRRNDQGVREYTIHSRGVRQVVQEIDGYENLLTNVAAKSLINEHTGMVRNRALLDAKITSLANPMALGQTVGTIASKLVRPVARFTRRVPTNRYLRFAGPKSMSELQKFLDLGVYGKNARRIMWDFVKADTDAARRAVLFSAKRQLFDEMGLLYNPHAQRFVAEQLDEIDHFYGGLTMADRSGVLKKYPMLPKTQLADAIRIPDLRHIVLNAERMRLTQAFSPVSGELSFLTWGLMNVWKQTAVFRPALMLRAGGLDETLSVVARHGTRDTLRMYTSQYALRGRARALLRGVERREGNRVLRSLKRRYGRIQARQSMRAGDLLPEADNALVDVGLLGDRRHFMQNLEKSRAINRYRDVLARAEGRAVVTAELRETEAALARLGIDPDDAVRVTSSKAVDRIMEEAAEHQLILDELVAEGRVPEHVRNDHRALQVFMQQAEVDDLFTMTHPIREYSGPGLHDAARTVERHWDKAIRYFGRWLDIDEDYARAVTRYVSDPVTQQAMSANAIYETVLQSFEAVADPLQAKRLHEIDAVLRFRGDMGEFGLAGPMDLGAAEYLLRTMQMFSADDMVNTPIRGITAVVPYDLRRTVGHQLRDIVDDLGDATDADGAVAPLRRIISGITDPDDRRFAQARMRFSLGSDHFRSVVWDYLDAEDYALAQEWDIARLTRSYNAHLRDYWGVGDGSDLFMQPDQMERFFDFFRTHGDDRARHLIGFDDSPFRPSVSYANATTAVRSGADDIYYHGANQPLAVPRSLREDAAAGWAGRRAAGPGVYVTQSAPYAAGYATTGATRGGTVPTVSRLRVKATHRNAKILNLMDPVDADRRALAQAADDLARTEGGQLIVDTSGAGDPMTLSEIVRTMADPGRTPRDGLDTVLRAVDRIADPDYAAEVTDALVDTWYRSLMDQGYAAFTDHDWDSAARTLGHAFEPGRQRNLVVFDEDALEVVDPMRWALGPEQLEVEAGNVPTAAGGPSSQLGALDEEYEKWAHWIAGDWDEDAAMEELVELTKREWRRPENRHYLERNSAFGPEQDYYGGPAGANDVIVYAPRSLTPRQRAAPAGRDTQLLREQASQQANLRVPPGQPNLLVGSTDPRTAQRTLEFLSNGRPDDWELVAIPIHRVDWEQRNAAFARDVFADTPGFDAFHAGAYPFHRGPDTIDTGVRPGFLNPDTQLVPIAQHELDAAEVLGHIPVRNIDEAVGFDDLWDLSGRIEDAGVTKGRWDPDAFGPSVTHHWTLDREELDALVDYDPQLAMEVLVTDSLVSNARHGDDVAARIDAEWSRWMRGQRDDETELAQAALAPIRAQLGDEWVDDLITRAHGLRLPDTLYFDPSRTGYRPWLRGKTFEEQLDNYVRADLPALREHLLDTKGQPVAELAGPASRGHIKRELIEEFQGSQPRAMIRPGMQGLSRWDETQPIARRISDTIRHARDEGFNLITKGIAEMSRTPQFLRYFRDALTDARAVVRRSAKHEARTARFADEFGEMFDPLTEVLEAELGMATRQMDTYAQVTDIADSEFEKLANHFGVTFQNRPQELAEFKLWAAGELGYRNRETQMALTAAIRKTSDFIDDSRVRSQFAALFDVIWPFTYATEQFIARWYNTAVHSPEMFRRMQLYYQGMYNSGVIYDDERLGPVYEIPYSGAITKGIATIFGLRDYVPGVNFQTSVAYSFAGLTDIGQLSAGPVLTFPLALLRPASPELIGSFEDALVGELGRGRSPLETVLPSSLTRFEQFVFGGLDNATTVAAIQYLSAYRPDVIPDVRYNDDGTIASYPTEAEVEHFYAEVEKTGRFIGLVKGLTGLFSPGAPQDNFDPEDLGAEFADLLDAGIPMEEAVALFDERHPDKMAYTVFRTSSPSGAPTDPSAETREMIDEHREFYETNSLAGPWLLPHRGGERDAELDWDAWSALQALNYREYRTGEEWFEAFRFARAANQYFPEQRKKEQLMLDAEGNPERRRAITAVWNQWKTQFFRKYPIFARDMQSREAAQRRQATRDQMRQALASPALPDAPQTDLIRQLMIEWDKLEAYNDRVDLHDTDERRAYRLQFHRWAQDLVQDDFMAQTFYERTMLRDLDIPEVID